MRMPIGAGLQVDATNHVGSYFVITFGESCDGYVWSRFEFFQQESLLN
jgi:hypothetical protein